MLALLPAIIVLFFFAGSLEAALPIPQTKPSTGSSSMTSDTSKAKAVTEVEDLATIKTESIPIPHPKPLGNSLTLSDHDKKIYRLIFSAQDKGDWDLADKYIARLTDYRLRGHYLFQRYMHPTEWRSSYEELYGWLNQYGDHPYASKAFRLATSRATKGSAPTPRPESVKIISGMMRDLNPEPPAYRITKRRSNTQSRMVRDLEREIDRNLRRDRVTISYNLLKTSEASTYMDAVEYDTVRAKIAASYLYVGKLDLALELAKASLERSGGKVPLAGWVAGLTSWENNDFNSAYQYFQLTALSKDASTWTIAAGAFWTSRAASKIGLFDQVSKWLNIAAQYDRTFYSVLAIKALGKNVQFNWKQPELETKHIGLIAQHEAGRRALLLAQVNQPHRASSELIRLHPGDNDSLKTALVAFASQAELPSFEMRFAHLFKANHDQFYDASLYPLGSWTPKGGYKVDKALIHAIVRQESRFDQHAENDYSGAAGLMQILPSTANHVMRSKEFSGRGRHRLKDPVTNTTIGQKYILELLNRKEVDFDIINLAIAYNAGPGNLRKWKRKLSDIEDSLLFIEMIPYKETRAYVERVLSNYWIYQMRLGEDTPTLDAIASGRRAKISL